MRSLAIVWMSDNGIKRFIHQNTITKDYSFPMLTSVVILLAGAICALAYLYLARRLLEALGRKSTRRLARKVRSHLHRKRVLRSSRLPTAGDHAFRRSGEEDPSRHARFSPRSAAGVAINLPVTPLE